VAEWADVADVGDLEEGKPTRVAVDGVAVLLVRIGEEYLAVGNHCTHQGAPLDKGVVKISGSLRTVTCPAHGSTFKLDDGKIVRPPAAKPLPTYEVKVEDSRVFARVRE
jgi:nitrite reductase/ring-hydroxylating ferredoxin subunit